jgi:hypothetical protein
VMFAHGLPRAEEFGSNVDVIFGATRSLIFHRSRPKTGSDDVGNRIQIPPVPEINADQGSEIPALPLCPRLG